MKCVNVYSSNMPLFVYVQFKGVPAATRLNAETVEEDEDNETLIVKNVAGKKVGEFRTNEVMGWWIQEEA
jgi:hypothetical protein